MKKYENPSLSPEERAKDLLSRLTLKEKAGQLNQHMYGFDSYVRSGDTVELSELFKEEVKRFGGIGLLYGLYRADPWSEKGFRNGLYGKTAVEAYNKIQEYIVSHSRFGIPALICEECPHGHQALGGYLLPVNLAMGCTWNPELVKSAFSVCAKQLSEKHVDFALISMLDILRDPRWGRSEECYSEDPYLAGRLAAAATSGMMSGGVDVVAKHFCAQGAATGGINAGAAAIGERELREIHLPAVNAAVAAGAKGIMAAYNEIDGIPCHANHWLLQSLLRKECGFEGIVMADGRAVDRLNSLAETSEEAAALALKSGVDVSLWDTAFTTLESAVRKGLVDTARLDEAVYRVLKLKFERGLFEHPLIEEKHISDFNFMDYPQTLKLAEESVVLLKNDRNTLPLSIDNTRIAVIGPLADDIYAQLGDYTPEQSENAVVTLLGGLRQIAPKKARITAFTSPFPVNPNEWEHYIRKAVAVAEKSDVVILAAGGSSSRFDDFVFADNGAVISKTETGEFMSLTDCGEGVDVTDVSLPRRQLDLLRSIKATGKPIITVIIAGRPYAAKYVAEQSDALLYAFYPGPAGGIALAKLLLGVVSPSGRLSVSLPNTSGQIPAFYNRKSSYAFRYSDVPESPVYPFGYGMSYSSIELSNFSLSRSFATVSEMEKNGLTVSCSVRNVGNYKTFAVLQIYIRDKIASVVPRVKELKAFTKTELAPGETARIEQTLPLSAFEIWDSEMRRTAEPGEFEIIIYESTQIHWTANFKITE